MCVSTASNRRSSGPSPGRPARARRRDRQAATPHHPSIPPPRSIPNVPHASIPPHGRPRRSRLHSRRRLGPRPAPPADFKPYTETIPGTELKFDLVPIPGGTFKMGSPAGEAKRGDDEGPQSTRSRSPRSGWASTRSPGTSTTQFAFSIDIKRKQREKRRPRTRSRRPRRAPTPSPGRRRPTPTRPSASAARGSRPSASRTTRRWNTAAGSRRRPARPIACRPRPSGSTPPRRHDDGLLVRRRPGASSATTPGTSRTPRSPSRSARRSRIPGASTTCTATSPSGASTTTRPTLTARSPSDSRPIGPVVLPTAKEYPYVARGGSWDDDAEKLRSAARLALEPRVERAGPAAAAEHLVAHRRDVRRLPRRPAGGGAGKSQGVQVARGEGQGHALV